MNNILSMKYREKVVEIEPFDQSSNGGSGITYTLYYFPHGLENDYEFSKSFSSMKKAIKKSWKLLKKG